MNVARKSTTKLPQNWHQLPKLQTKLEEADSGIGSTDSTDSFQDALLNLKALNGGSDIVESDRSELKELQSACSAEKREDGNKNLTASESKQNNEEKDILDQIDDIVKNNPEMKNPSNGVSDASRDAKSDTSSDVDDDILIINEDNSNDNDKQSKETTTLQKLQLGHKNKTVSGTSSKNPLRIGEKVRSTVHNIMTKLVQSNPDVNSLLSKTKQDGFVDNSGSGPTSPLSVRQDKRNLFDNFDISDRDSKSPLIADDDINSVHDFGTKESDGKQEDPPLKNDDISRNGMELEESEASKTKSDELKTKGQTTSSSDELSLDCSQSDSVKSDIQQLSSEISKIENSDQSRVTVAQENVIDALVCLEKGEKLDDCLDKTVAKESDLTKGSSSPQEENSFPAQSSSNCANTNFNLPEPSTATSKLTETAELNSCDESADKVEERDSDIPKDKLCDTVRKRQHKNCPTQLECDSQPQKRSRLDEVIGKLGERVTIPSVVAENDSFEYEDSTPGDTESAEKQSEVSGSASEDEEDKSSLSNSKSKTLTLTKQELESLVIASAKTAIEEYYSSEILGLNRRIEELKQSQDEWRQKARDLERQVLDLTVLQQRLEKRKAHTAALKSITTRSIGIGVTEDKLKTNTPQKHQSSKTPPAAGGIPVTPPATSVSTLIWTPTSLPVNRLLATTPPVSTSSTITQSLQSRNTSVAHLLSQTARMPTVASCAAANRPAQTKSTSTAPRPALSLTTLPVNQTTSATPLARGANTTTVPTSGLVLVNSTPGVPLGSKVMTSSVNGASLVTTSGSTQVKIIDLTMEDDAGGSKQSGKQVVASGQLRNIVPQVVRQIPPLSQGKPGVPSSAILLSSPAGTQVVNAGNFPRPGMLQVVTFANAGPLRPGSLLTVVPGQTGAMVRHPTAATTLTTNAREPAPVLMTQQLPPGMTFVRTPAILGNNATVRASLESSSAAATAMAPTSRIPVTLTAVPSSAAAAASGPVQQESVVPAAAPTATKENPHPAPLPHGVCPRTLPADAKSPPPRPGLKISRVKQGIVLSWNMILPNDSVDIASYQLFAYQEGSAAPQTSLWKKVGDVKALPLPMACTLTQFQDGNKYHFAVRAIDIYGRSGPFSEPSYIYLTKASS